ncbi:MAG TPA: LysR substrate-binding domain-containing protein [Kofleriaceae bacterium]|nr:LysR substrate-binding domain-containing protein [Kofleriaceae bacterium]
MDATIDDLRTLAAVVRAGTMARAAAALRVDKATISRRLAHLERLRPGLFERQRGRLTATAAGARSLAVVEDVERDLARLEATLARTDEGGGVVRLTVPAPIAARLVVPALAGFRARHPEVELAIVATSRVLDLARGEADVAVRNLVPRGPGIVARRVARVSYTLYAARTYLAARGVPAPRSLRGHDVVDFADGTPGTPPLDWLPAAVREARVVMRANDPTLLTQAVAAGLGIAALPAFLADDEPGLVRLGADVVVSPVSVVVRAEVRRLARVRAVAAWVGDLLAARTAWLERAAR